MALTKATYRFALSCVVALFLALTSVARSESDPVDEAAASVVRVINVITVAKPDALKQEIHAFKSIDMSRIGELYSTGSGFVINSSGLVVTNQHMIRPPDGKFGEEVAQWLRMVIAQRLKKDKEGVIAKSLAEQFPGADIDAVTKSIAEGISEAGDKLVEAKAIVISTYVCHQVQGEKQDRAMADDGDPQGSSVQVQMLSVEVLNQDEGMDLAVLKVNGLKARPLTLNTSKLRRGDWVSGMGFPAVATAKVGKDKVADWIAEGRPNLVRTPSRELLYFTQVSLVPRSQVRGLVYKPWEEGQPDLLIVESDSSFGHGNSGGPLLNSVGQVVGVNTMMAALSEFDQERMSSHSSVLSTLLDQWGIHYSHTSRRPSTQRPWLLIVLISFAALTAMGALILAFFAFRRPAQTNPAPGRTMILNLIEEVRNRSRLLRNSPALQNPPAPRIHQNQGQNGGGATPPGGQYPQYPQNGGGPPYQPPAPLGRSYELRCTNGGSYNGQLTVQLQADHFARRQSRLVVGRSPDLADVIIGHKNISKTQAAFHVRDGKLFIEDLGSSNGTAVNGIKLNPRATVVVSEGDVIIMGGVAFQIREVRQPSYDERSNGSWHPQSPRS